MQLSLNLTIPPLPQPITYSDTIFLTGSCFTEHMAERLLQSKYKVTYNPHGILFNPLSVSSGLIRCLEATPYAEADLFYLNEVWNSWQHHSRFSHIDKAIALQQMNSALTEAHISLQKGQWVIITLGSAFQYYLKEGGLPVANNHRAPAQWFEKQLLPIADIIEALESAFLKLMQINPQARILLTVSPVRHIREGVVENNRSKARLLESVHTLSEKYHNVFYFPAYELLIDILRDYRFYDIDFVHPNFLSTNYVWERFMESCISPKDYALMEAIKEITTAVRHKPRFPDTLAHRRFKETYAAKCWEIMTMNPNIDLKDEYVYFQ